MGDYTDTYCAIGKPKVTKKYDHDINNKYVYFTVFNSNIFSVL